MYNGKNYLERILLNRFTSASGVMGALNKIFCASWLAKKGASDVPFVPMPFNMPTELYWG
jgi:hypothetical protein